MARTFHCVICNTDIDVDLETHIAERHSEPGSKRRTIGEEELDLTDAEYVRRLAVAPPAVPGRKAARTVPPPTDILESLGVKESDLGEAQIDVAAGAVCSKMEAKLVMEAVEEYVDFKIDRANWLISFVKWGLMTAFSEATEDAGGFVVKQNIVAGSEEVYVKMADILPEINDRLNDEGLGREFTYRRLGRYLAPEIPKMISKNPDLQQLARTGTPISNRMGIAPALYLTCSSIFESIKSLKDWTDQEKAAYFAYTASVKKVARGSKKDALPQDLRIDPEMASQFRAEGKSDFASRYMDRYRQDGDSASDGRLSRGSRMLNELLDRKNSFVYGGMLDEQMQK
ncbi:hypothetical protein K491DRAFT_718881 [Lophiostoma macrostomum CBS 122681]|uniref:Uncharacterized protein n=1 Tax=Lophiostoma macrostomum CBS 122681 TaxID=1314788 RepID=A0A6A6T1X3_9PLEO|nr:hypothetical protein K491DRAFT_718881 [Lophiostoma macrostomum CBS 122681]